MNSTGLIVLAAGASTRLGKPKQQLLYNGKSLLQHAVQVATESGCIPIRVVVGANADLLDLPEESDIVQVITNPEWEEGMASSIRYGLTSLIKSNAHLESVIIMACDQPFVTPELLQQLIQKHLLTQQPIIACAYQDTLGVPALFHQTFFTHLLALQGQSGAKKLFLSHPEAVANVPFALGHIDIDTPSDYAALQQQTPEANK